MKTIVSKNKQTGKPVTKNRVCFWLPCQLYESIRVQAAANGRSITQEIVQAIKGVVK